jgi:hypothetical protein
MPAMPPGPATKRTDQLILKRAALSRPSGQWSDDDYDVLCEGKVVGRIYRATGKVPDYEWFWGRLDRPPPARPTDHGDAATREDAMAAFAKAWRRE